MSSETLYGLAAEFDSPEAILQAAQIVRRYGYRDARTYTPFPVSGLAEIFGFQRTWIPAFFLAGGIFGASGGFFMQWFANVIHLPWDIGGRPPNSWPAFIPITFEMGILFAALTGVTAMIALNRLPQPYHAMFHLPAFERASRDRFFLCIKSTDVQFNLEKTADLLKSLHPLSVLEVPQ